MTVTREFIEGLPKAELHLHIEGTFEPELVFEIAQRNNVILKYKSIQELKKAYDFKNLQEFLDLYYAVADVLIKEQDFYDLTWAYLSRAKKDNVIHTEIFFDPQTHTARGISFDTVINGINNALKFAEKQYGITTKLIMSFLRHLDENDAIKTLKQAEPYKNLIVAVGLDSSELGNPPSKFEKVFTAAREQGYLCVAHAGEEGPASYVWEALRLLHISRLDHGNNSMNDGLLVKELANRQMCLTSCPLSNLKLKVVKDLKEHPLRNMLQKGLCASVNSDDPAYFGGYMNENFIAITEALDLTKEELRQIVKNSFYGSFIDQDLKEKYLSILDDYFEQNK